MQNKKNGKKKQTRKEILLDEFLRNEDGVFDDEDEDDVTDDTLEFLSLDDEMIKSYQQAHKCAPAKSKKSSQKSKKVYEDDRYEEDRYEDEDDRYEDEEDRYEDEDDRYEDDRYEDEEDRYEDEDDRYEDEEDRYEDEDDRYEDEEDRYEDEDDRYEDEEDRYEDEEDRYEDEDDRYEDEEDRYEDEEDRYEDEDDRYEDEEDRYEDEDDWYEDDEYEDEDDWYEDDEYEDEDDEYDDDDGIIVRFKRFLTEMSSLDVVVAMLGIVVLAGVIVTGSLYVNAKSVEKQVETFASVGEEMEGISVIGESGLLAVAESAKLSGMIDMDQPMDVGQQTEPGEVQSKTIEVGLNITSIQSDMKIKFVNKATGKLIGGVPFEVEVTGGKTTLSYQDDDKDGIIYKTEVPAGTYNVTVKPLAGDAYQDYRLPSSASSVTVTDTITYKKVDVADEVKTEAEVNVAAEDTAVQDTVVESTLKDTVEWVESTKKPVGDAKEGYEEVPKANIPDPLKVSSVYRKMVEGGSQSEEGSGTPAPGGNEQGNDNVNEGNPGGDNPGGDNSTSSGSTTQTPAPTISISINPNSISLKEGESKTLSAEVTGTNEAPVWNSSDSAVAAVGGSGTSVSVTAGKAGTATITATVGGVSASCIVTVEAKPAPEVKVSVSLSQTSLSLEKSKSATLTATASPADSQITWVSNNPSVATVENGLVTAVSKGTATITVTATKDGKSDSKPCTVTVTETAPTVTVTLDQSNISVKKGTTAALKATVTGITNPSITWVSNNTNVATVSNGTVTAVEQGTTVITAAVSVNNIVYSASCTVTVQPADAKIIISGTTDVAIGKTTTLTAQTEPKGSKVVWASANDKVAKVDANGVVTGVAVGTTEIIVHLEGNLNVYTTCKVTVKESNDKITVSGPKEVAIGKTITLTAQTNPKGSKVVWASANDKIAKVDANGVVTGVAEGATEIIVHLDGDVKTFVTYKVTVKKDTGNKLKDKDGNQLYCKDATGAFREATYDDYKTQTVFYKKSNVYAQYLYTGWQTIDGYVYFFDKTNNYVTGEQVIQGAKYNFGSDGKLSAGSGTMGIDVSKWNGSIDWNAVKNSGVSYVIIRCGYRGSSTGALIEDPLFRSNIKGAKAAGLKVGAYFFSQAVNEVEAVEEASMAVNLCSGYGLNYPIFLDVESSGGRGDGVSKDTRTAVCKAFCATVQNSGYSAGIYANKTWLNEKINTASLTGYKIWLAQYASAPTYSATRYDMWQYSSKGKVSGISGSVDMNVSYMSY